MGNKCSLRDDEPIVLRFSFVRWMCHRVVRLCLVRMSFEGYFHYVRRVERRRVGVVPMVGWMCVVILDVVEWDGPL